MPKSKEYSQDLKEKVISSLEAGRRQAHVAREFNLARHFVSVWNKHKINRETLETQKRSGRPRKTNAREDITIIRAVKLDPKRTSIDITHEITGKNLHFSTVKRRLLHAGLYERRPCKKPFISMKNRKARMRFAKEPISWNTKQYNLFSSDGIRYIRRPINKRNDIKYQVPTVKHGGGNVMVWGCFSRDGIGPLHRINGIMDKFMYADILKKHMLPHAKLKMPRGWWFQQDNDPKHASKHVKE